MLLRGVATPVAILVALMLVGHRFWRLKDDRLTDPLPALACGAALTIAFIAMFGWTGVPPKEHWQWMLVTIWGATVAALIAPLLTRIHVLRVIIWLVVAAATAWLILPSWEMYAGKRNWYIGGVAAVVLANLESTSHLSRKRFGLAPLFLVTIGTILTSIVMLYAHQAKFAQVCGSVASVMGFLFLVSLLLRRREPILGVMAIPSILIPVLAFSAFFYYSDGETFPTEFALAAITPLMVALVTLIPMGRLKGWKRFAIAQIVCIVPVAIGVVMLLMTVSDEAPDYQY